MARETRKIETLYLYLVKRGPRKNAVICAHDNDEAKQLWYNMDLDSLVPCNETLKIEKIGTSTLNKIQIVCYELIAE